MNAPVNVFTVAVAGDEKSPPGYRARDTRLGPAIGAAKLGGTVYELDPGDSICPYHWEGVEEEWLLVLSGHPTLRDPDGEHELGAGDVVAFLPGPGGGHKITNRSDSVLRVMMLSTMPKNAVSICVYPDSDKVGVWPPGVRLRLTPSLDYWDGEV